MRSGVSFPSFAGDATYAMLANSAKTDFPVQNLSDLYNVRSIFESSAVAATAFSAVFSATRTIQLLTLVHTNAGALATVRYRLYSDAAMTALVYDTGVTPMFPTGSAPSTVYPQNFPLLLPAPTACRAIRIDLSSQQWQIGAVELSGWWEWDDVAVSREIGIKTNDVVVQQPFGVDHVMSQFSPRTIKATRNMADQAENSTTALDFQLEKKTSRPFIWCWDIADPTTYPRECVLVRNSALTPPQQQAYPGGTQTFNFQEHLH